MPKYINVQTWAAATSTHAGNGRQIIFRFAKDLDPAFDIASQPDRVIIVWKYKSATGQPVAEEYQRMNLLEDSIDPVLDAGRFATLALVSTGEDLREWIYYAKDGDEFIERVNLALVGMSAFPIEIHMTSDPTWANYMQFKTGLRFPIN